MIFSSCAKEQDTENELSTYLPQESALIIQTNSLINFLTTVDSTEFFKDNASLLQNSSWDHLKNFVALTSPEKALVAIVNREKGRSDYLVISDSLPEIKIDSLRNHSLETLKFESYEIKKTGTEDFITFTSSIDETYFASSSLQLLQNTLKNEQKELLEDENFKMVMAAADPNKTTLFINNSELDKIFNKLFVNIKIPVLALSAWTTLDLEIVGENLILNGVASSAANSADLLDIFEGMASQPNEISQITPAQATGFYSFTYQNFEKFYRKLADFRKDSSEVSSNHLLNFSKEAGVIFFETNNVFVLNTTDPVLAAENFPSTEQVSMYREFPVFINPEPDIFSEKLHPLVTENNLKFYAYLGNFMLFSETIAGIETVISNYQNNTTYSKRADYSEAVENLAGSSSLLFVWVPEKFKSSLAKAASQEDVADIKELDLQNYSFASLQFVQETDFAHVHGFLLAEGETPKTETVSEIGVIKLKSPLGTRPFVVNMDKQPEVLVQDEENILYLYSRNGDLQWKKQISGRILGEIHQVDIFKNGNIQIVFATPGEVHMLDRNGNSVKPFPLEFKDPVTQPLSVFDYDNKRDYRLVVTQDQNLLMYDGKGKQVKGFDFGKTGSQIARPPKHIRMGSKDYIVVPELDGSINILSRQGRSRISVKEKVQTVTNWYENQRKFVSATEDGNLVFINENGKVETLSSSTNGNLEVTATENLLVSLSENILRINGKEINLDFGLYTPPQIFGSGKNQFVAVTDTQAKRVYIFDSNGHLLPGLPVYGNSVIDLSTGNNAVFAVQGEDNSVLVYQL